MARGLLLAPLGPMFLFVNRGGEQNVPFIAYSYAIAMVSGVPVLLIYELLGLRRLWHYLIGGFAIPFVVGMGLLLTIAYDPQLPWDRIFGRSAALASLCAIGATTFWFVAIRPLLPSEQSARPGA